MPFQRLQAVLKASDMIEHRKACNITIETIENK